MEGKEFDCHSDCNPKIFVQLDTSMLGRIARNQYSSLGINIPHWDILLYLDKALCDFTSNKFSIEVVSKNSFLRTHLSFFSRSLKRHKLDSLYTCKSKFQFLISRLYICSKSNVIIYSKQQMWEHVDINIHVDKTRQQLKAKCHGLGIYRIQEDYTCSFLFLYKSFHSASTSKRLQFNQALIRVDWRSWVIYLKTV